MVEDTLAVEPLWIRLAAGIICRMPAGRYRLMNYFLAQPKEFWRQMPEHLGGNFFRCNLRDSIAREVCFTRQYEPQETALVRELLKPGMTFVDVGANWGYFSLLAAHLVGEQGKVVSLEPDPRIYPLLKQNVERNDLRHICHLQVAAADQAGILNLAGYTEEGGNFGVSRIVEQRANDHSIFAVRAVALDDLLNEVGVDEVDLMKMDIEGAEGWALAGLRNHLMSYRIHRLLLELHPAQLAEHGHLAQQIVAELQQHGYIAWKIDHSFIATRQAAYSKQLDLRKILTPFDAKETLGNWPHLLLVQPGVKSIF